MGYQDFHDPQLVSLELVGCAMISHWQQSIKLRVFYIAHLRQNQTIGFGLIRQRFNYYHPMSDI